MPIGYDGLSISAKKLLTRCQRVCWERSIYFDIPFLNAVGGVAFWQAAFSSTESYLELLNEVISEHQFITFTAQDLLLARSVVARFSRDRIKSPYSIANVI